MIEDDEQSPPSFNGYEFVISGSGLKYFHYEGEFQFDFILNSQLLEEVHIKYFPPENGPITVINYFLKLLRYTYDVPRLGNALCLLDIPEVVIQLPVSVLNGVRLLDLDYETSDLSNMGLLMMLRNVPCLESLVFFAGIKMPCDPIEDVILDPLPPCFLYRLFFIYIFITEGDEKELMGVKVLLNNSLVLEEMGIGFSELVKEDIRKNSASSC